MRKQVVGALAWVGLLLVAGTADAVKIEYKVKKGDEWKLKSTIKGTGEMEVAGMKVPMTLEMVVATTQKVTEVKANGEFTTTITSKTESGKITAAGMEVPIPNPPDQKPVTVTMSKTGKPIKVEGLQVGGAGGQPDFSKLMNLATGLYPEKDVKEGDTWDASPDAAAGVPMKITGKLIKATDKSGDIEYTFKLSGEAFGKLMKSSLPPGANIEVGGDGMSGKMTQTVDLTNGVPGANKGNMDMNMVLKFQGMEIKQTFKMNITTEVAK